MTWRNILIIFHFDLATNSSDIIRKTYLQVKDKHPDHNILIWSMPLFFDLLYHKQIQDLLATDLFISIIEYSPRLIYLSFPNTISTEIVSNAIDNLKFHKELGGPFYRNNFENLPPYTTNIEKKTATRRLIYIDFELMNNLDFQVSYSLANLFPPQNNNFLVASVFRPINTCANTISTLDIKPKDVTVFYDKNDKKNIHKKSYKILNKLGIPIFYY